MKKQIGMAFLCAAVLAASGAARAEDEGAGGGKPAAATLEKQEAQLKAVQPSLVIVEYTLQYDKGEQPQGKNGIGDLVKEERPLEAPGILVDGTHVVSEDVQIHPRFIKSIAVRTWTSDVKKGARVAATVSGWAKDRDFQMLELAGALQGAVPAAFDAKRAGPLSLVAPSDVDGEWAVKTQGFSDSLLIAGSRKLLNTETPGLVVDAKGQAVGLLGRDETLPGDESWKGSPMQWPMVSAADMQKTLASLDDRASKSIVRVMLNFRSPKNVQADQFGGRGDAAATVQYVLGVLTDDSTVLVLSEMKPTLTARLERIKVLATPEIEAKFKASLTDYGAFVATLDKPAAGMGLAISKADIESLEGTALPTAQVFMQGEKRVSYVQPRRIAGFNLGWKRNLYPDIGGEAPGLFLFDPAGALLALPISRREKVSTEERYGGRGGTPVTSVAQLAEVLGDLKTSGDPGNVPLTEEQENRLAWLGFEMQPMNTELARANNVSDQTNDGQTGALVTYVYPDSPAGKAGVEAGWVLLRIDAEGQPKPIDVQVQNEPFAERAFPWDRLEGAPEGVFDQIFQYSPWPMAENAVVRVVTDLGFGKKFTAEFFHDGKLDKKPFTVVEGPAHFDNAPKYKQEALGLTVKDLTYEVRRYMQKKPDDPGVIVGKIEIGSRASKAGIKPYEVITQVNDQPVMNVKDFEKLTKDQKEVRLSVKRMTHGRIVKITLTDAPGAATGPAEKPGGAPAAPAAPDDATPEMK